MDIAQQLEETKQRQRELVNRFNQIKQEEQEAIQELLRMDGEVRILHRLDGNSKKSPKP